MKDVRYDIRVPTDLTKYLSMTVSLLSMTISPPDLEFANVLVVTKKIKIYYNSGAKLVKFHDCSQKSVGQSFMFHDFQMIIYIFQVFQSPGEP